jgi:hypothetical protein
LREDSVHRPADATPLAVDEIADDAAVGQRDLLQSTQLVVEVLRRERPGE